MMRMPRGRGVGRVASFVPLLVVATMHAAVAQVAPGDGLHRLVPDVLTYEDYPPLTTDMMVGASVFDPGGRHVAEIGSIEIDANGRIVAFVLEVGGIAGLGESLRRIGADRLTVRRTSPEAVRIVTSLTAEELRALPESSAGGSDVDSATPL